MELQDPDNSCSTNNAGNPNPDPANVEYFGSSHDDIDSSCSTPYVSAPSSPGRGNFGGGFFYSAPASPMHFTMLSLSKQSSTESSLSKSGSFEFEFSARFVSSGSGSTGSMSSADELFHNGQIRPMKLSSHLESPQVLAPLLDLEAEQDDDDFEDGRPGRGRDSRMRDGSVHRRARSMSPMRNVPFLWIEDEDGDGASCSAHKESSKKTNGSLKNGEDDSNKAEETTPSVSASSSRSSSAGRSSKRWVFLKDFLHSKSEGRSNNKFWSTISFSLAGKEKKSATPNLGTSVPKEKCTNMPPPETTQKLKGGGAQGSGKKPAAGKPANGLRKRRVPLSAHELHYTANRAQAEELRKKTYLPYRQGLLGCLGFSSKGYGAINGFARALNPVSSR